MSQYWKIPKIWQDEDVWILGGGPSVTKQFNIPEAVVGAVMNKELPLSVYSQYLHPIHNKHVIGVNIAYMIGTWMDMIFFGDKAFFLFHQHGLSAYPGIKVSSHPKTQGLEWVNYVPRERYHLTGLSPNPRTICWNANSGAAAIDVAVHAGAKRVLLLGMDMQVDEVGRQHWHDEYHTPKMKKQPFDTHLRAFPDIAKDAQAKGVEIINVSPDSAIHSFPKVTLKEVL